MRAVRWHGVGDVRVDSIPDPAIVNPRDAIVRVTSTAICGSDLHLYDGYIPTMKSGDVLGHEFMGEIVDLGPAVENLRIGDRVVVPFTISCGRCWNCQHELWSLCDNSNPNGWMAKASFGHSCSGLFGYSHMMGGYAGGQAELVRVPFADVGCFPVPQDMSDEQVLFLSDILPTAFQAAEQCDIEPGDVVAIWGLGPVGLLTVRCALMLGAHMVIAIDDVPERLAMAERQGAVPLDFSAVSVLEALDDMTGGRGPDACIDVVGLEAHGHGLHGGYDKVKQTLRLQTDRPQALREAIQACRTGGVVSVPGVYGGLLDKMPFGAAFNKALTFKMGQTHVHRYMRPLFERIREGDLDPTFVITHRIRLDEAPEAYRMFRAKRDGCVKVVATP